jgi:hypothetical protein
MDVYGASAPPEDVLEELLPVPPDELDELLDDAARR